MRHLNFSTGKTVLRQVRMGCWFAILFFPLGFNTFWFHQFSQILQLSAITVSAYVCGRFLTFTVLTLTFLTFFFSLFSPTGAGGVGPGCPNTCIYQLSDTVPNFFFEKRVLRNMKDNFFGLEKSIFGCICERFSMDKAFRSDSRESLNCLHFFGLHHIPCSNKQTGLLQNKSKPRMCSSKALGVLQLLMDVQFIGTA